AVSGTVMSTSSLKAVGGTSTASGPPIWSPPQKIICVPSGQSRQPLLRKRHVFSNGSPGANCDPSGTVTSSTNSAQYPQPVGEGIASAGWVGEGVLSTSSVGAGVSSVGSIIGVAGVASGWGSAAPPRRPGALQASAASASITTPAIQPRSWHFKAYLLSQSKSENVLPVISRLTPAHHPSPLSEAARPPSP